MSAASDYNRYIPYGSKVTLQLYLRGIKFLRQQPVPIPYKDMKLGTDLRLDLLVEEKVIVDLKAKEFVTAIDHQKSDHIYG